MVVPPCVSIVEMAIPRRSTVRGRAIAARRKVREYAMVARALASHFAPRAGADYPYTVLQPELRLLQ